MKNIGYYNGIVDSLENLKIPVLDRAVYFGDGVYDVAYAINWNIISLDEHLDRLYKNLKLLKINEPLEKNNLKSLIIDLSKRLDNGNLQIYFQISRGSAIREHAFSDDMQSNLLIMINEKEIIKDKYVDCITKEDTRFYHCNIKTLNLIPSVLAAKEALDKGVYEVIFHRNKRITECSHSNVHIMKNGRFITAPEDNLILPGISRKHLIEKMRLDGVEVLEKEYYLEDLYSADIVYITAAGAPCLKVKKIDNIHYKID